MEKKNTLYLKTSIKPEILLIKINQKIKVQYLKNKECLIFPKSPLTTVLRSYLEENNVIFKGYIDNNKSKKDTLLPSKINQINFDYILIYSPVHAVEIFEQINKQINECKIIVTCLNKNTYKYDFFCYPIDLINRIKKEKWKNESYFNNKLKHYKSSNFKDEILLIGLDFVDLNIKYLYLYLKNNTSINAYIATNNNRDLKTLREAGYDVVSYPSKKFIDLVFKCKVKVVDHSPTTKLIIDCMKIGKSVQLWHGVTVKMLGKQANYKAVKYDLVVSTSDFVTEYSFSKLYDYKYIINTGYPRNDIFYKRAVYKINVDQDLLCRMKDKLYKYVIYMPTYRPLGFNDNPISIEDLNQFAVSHNIKFIFKMHPFVAQKSQEGLKRINSSKKITHIIFHDPHKDIYPLLKYSDLLITDYSSVYFDYLHLNKPILFFPYDYENWKESADGVMLDYFKYSPGDMSFTYNELKKGIIKSLNNDKFQDNRKLIFEKMFENRKGNASNLITNKIKSLFFNEYQ